MKTCVVFLFMGAALSQSPLFCGQTEQAGAALSPAAARETADSDSRIKYAETLRSPFSRKSVNILLGLLKDPVPEVRAQAAVSLGEQGHKKAFHPLLNSLAGDTDAAVREASAQALGKMQDTHAAPALTRASNSDPSVKVRAAALVALGKLLDSPDILPPFAQALKDKTPSLRAAAAEALGYERGYQTARLLVGAMLNDPDELVRAKAAAAAGLCCSAPAERVRINAGFLANDPAIFDPLWDPVPFEEINVRLAKGSTPAEEIVLQALISLLVSDKSPAVRAAAALGLGHSESSAAVPPLISALKTDTDGGVRADAAMALGDLRAAGALEALTEALQDKDPDVRMDAETASELLKDASGK